MPDELTHQELLSKAANDELEQQILRTLEAAPEIEIPAGFAARVSSQLPAHRPLPLTPTHYGRNAGIIGMFVTLVALIALALHNEKHATFGLAESLLLLQFLALTIWLSIRRRSFS
jgi:hypothetical protein